MLNVEDHLKQLIERYPVLEPCRADIDGAYQLMAKSYAGDGKLLIAGNGGSAADADHIVGELLKGFASVGKKLNLHYGNFQFSATFKVQLPVRVVAFLSEYHVTKVLIDG